MKLFIIILILWLLFGLIILAMNKAIMKEAKMKMNVINIILVLILWPVFITTTIPGYRDLLLSKIAKEVSALINKDNLQNQFSGLAGMMGSAMNGNINPINNEKENKNV